MKTVRGERVSGAAALMVFCIFAMLVFSVIMLGAGAYRNIAGASRDGSEERVCLSYVWTMVKNSDGAGNVYVEPFGGIPALHIVEVYGDSSYQTIIYHHDGWVCELFAEAGHEFSPEYGSRVIEVGALEFEQLEDGNIVATSGELSVFIAPRGGMRYDR